MKHQTDRRVFLRRLLASASALALTSCDKLSNSEWFGNVLSTGESLNKSTHHLLRTRKAMAQEFSEADLSPSFRVLSKWCALLFKLSPVLNTLPNHSELESLSQPVSEIGRAHV